VKEQLNFVNDFAGDEAWIYQVFIVVFITLLGNFIAKRSFDKLEKQIEKTVNVWDDALILAARKPVRYMIWLVGLSVIMEVILPFLEEQHLLVFNSLQTVGVISLITWFVYRFITEVEKNLKTPGRTKEPMDETTVMAIARLLRLSVVITAGLVVLQSLGFSVSGVLAFGGIGGIAVGFAAKDLLSNFFGGLMIYLDRPFSVGDWVRSPDRSIEGTVEHIGWRLSVIRTFDKRPLYVPNAVFANIAVENPSRMTYRRIYETLGVRYDDSKALAKIIEDVKAMLVAHPEIENSQTMIVNFNSYGPSSLDFFIYKFTKTTNWIKYHEVKQDVLFQIMQIVEANGAEFAFPTQTLHVQNESDPEGQIVTEAN
jgi:MscS family membrane protein